ncbi:MAG: hypothetical protein N3G20_06115, partial [Verrucomicrobiae bacterium]|nr:hypothetical protein [Verrucomicrobiae bacterium]
GIGFDSPATRTIVTTASEEEGAGSSQNTYSRKALVSGLGWALHPTRAGFLKGGAAPRVHYRD